jgi:hypothetical protein
MLRGLKAGTASVVISLFAALSVQAQEKGPTQAQGTSAAPALPSATYSYPDDGAKLGQGWDSFNNRGTTATCVEFVEAKLERSSFETQVEQIQSSYSLVTKTTTSVSASYSGFGVSASGEVSSSHSLSINSDDQNFLFTFRSLNGSTFAVPVNAPGSPQLDLSEQGDKTLGHLKSDLSQDAFLKKYWAAVPERGGFIKLTNDALALRKRSKIDFDRICGDGFVSAIHRGSRISVLLSHRFSSRAEANSLTASLSASGYGASGSASYSTSTQKLNSTNNLSYRVFQQGGVPSKPQGLPALAKDQFFDVNLILPTPDQLISGPTAFSVTIVPYENAMEDLDGKLEFPSPLKLVTYADYYLALRDHYRLVEAILNQVRVGKSDASSPFDPKLVGIFYGEKGLEQLYDDMHFDLAFLEGMISACYTNHEDCTLPKSIKVAIAGYKKKLDRAKVQRPQDVAVTIFEKRLQALDGAVDKSTGLLDVKFFMKFFQYLALTPLPKAAYTGSDFQALIDLKYATNVAGDAAKQSAAANDGLRRAMLTYRYAPWKRFFCETLNSSPMCVSEAGFRPILEQVLPKINVADLTPVSPPPPPPEPDVTPIYDRYPCGVPNWYGCL